MKSYPVGAATYSKHPDRYAKGAPTTAHEVDGAYVYDSDGHEWVDLTSGMGAVILGHGYVDARIIDQLGHGIAFPLPNELEQQVADRLLSMLTWEKAESVRFGKNGADVTTSAVRLARAVTHRVLVVYCDYHGHSDWCMVDPPMNGGVHHNVRWSHKTVPTALHTVIPTLKPAAVVIEGASSVSPGRERRYPVGFWDRLRKVCDTNGTLLILDEMVTGFRMAPGGAAEALGIEPDIACYGKAMANGMPLSAVVGPWDILKRYEEDVFFSLTHGGEALSLAAADETLRIVVEENVPARIGELGQSIIDILGDRVTYGYPQRLVFDFTKKELGVLLKNGVLCAGYANLTLAHAKDEVARRMLLEALALLA